MTEPGPSGSAATTDHAHESRAALPLRDDALSSLLLALLEQWGAGLAIKNAATGRYVYADARTGSVFGKQVDAVGRNDSELFGSEAAASMRSADQTAGAQTALHVTTQRIERDGQRREFDVLRLPLTGGDGDVEPLQLACIWIDSTAARLRDAQHAKVLQQLEQQQVANEALRRETSDSGLRDAPTGLFQRGHFEEQLRREVDLSSREHREFALVSIELDPFADDVKALGETARNRVLEAVGRLLRNNTRAMDASCRMDADHFAILLSGVGLATAHSRMEGLRRQCATQVVVLDGREIGFSVSMGVASFPHTAHSQDELVSAAELALHEASRRGGNHVTLASIRFDA